MRIKLDDVPSGASFLGGPGVKNLPVSAVDTGSFPGLEKPHVPGGN